MKTNIFKLKSKNEKNKKIVIEEEKTKNPIILFLKRYKMVLLMIFFTIVVLSLLISVGFAFSLLRGSNDYDISYIDGSDKINSNTDPTIKDDDVKRDLLGDEARSVGVVVLVETFMSGEDIIEYYTDGTSIIVTNGKIYRVFPKKNGNYGIDRNGVIDKECNKILVESTTTTLSDGSIITYYTDGTAKVQLKFKTIFVRDSNNVKTENGTVFVNTAPSGVALAKNIQKNATQYTDGTTYVVIGERKFVVNKNRNVDVIDGVPSFERYNSFESIGEKKYSDGSVINIFENGSAIITDKSGNTLYVKKSGDILLKSKKLYEISPNDYGYSMSNVKSSDGKQIIYYDNGAAIIIYSNGDRKYVEDSDDVIYDENRNIVSNLELANKLSEKTTTDGEKVYNFDNGKSQVIRSNGNSYIVDTSKLTFKSNGEIDDSDVENKPGHGSMNAGEGIYISEAENKYNDFKNVESTVFLIKNNNKKRKVLRITIQEIKDYKKYNIERLSPKYVKFQATFNKNSITPLPAILSDNVWYDSDNNENYIIYDGVIEASSTVRVALSLYVDYSELDNSYQNKAFIGTIKVYVEDET